MTNFPGRAGFESGVDEPTRRALFDVDRRVAAIEAGGGGAEYLNDLLDVNVPTPSGQQVLTYNDLNMEWEANTPTTPSAPPVPRVIKTSTPGTYNFVKADYPNLVWFRAMLAGGGAGGGGAAATAASEASVGSGGGGSGYAELIVTDLSTIAASEPYTVGAGGAGGVGTSTTPADGDPTTLLGVTAGGGKNGISGASVAFDYLSSRGGNGGSTSGTRTVFANGQPGSGPFASGQRNVGGNGGTSHYGNGGRGGNAATSTGGNGDDGFRGGGGGGAANRPSQATARSGGDGGDGFVWFELWETP